MLNTANFTCGECWIRLISHVANVEYGWFHMWRMLNTANFTCGECWIRLISHVANVSNNMTNFLGKRWSHCKATALVSEKCCYRWGQFYTHTPGDIYMWESRLNIREFPFKRAGISTAVHRKKCLYSHSTLWEFTFKCDGISIQKRVNNRPESNVRFVDHHPSLVSVIICRRDGWGVAVTWTAGVLDDHTLTLDTSDRVRSPSEESLTEERVWEASTGRGRRGRFLKCNKNFNQWLVMDYNFTHN